MAKFRKKPVVIEAFQFVASVDRAIPKWAEEAYSGGVLTDSSGEYYVDTLEGAMRFSEGDWIIQGVNGEIYPCKPDIFEKTYERVGDD